MTTTGTDPRDPIEAPTTEAGRRFVHYAENVQRAIHPVRRQPTEPHVCREPEACDLILEAKQHVLAIEAAARDEGRREAVREMPSADDIAAVLNQHESECTYYDGGDFTCSCGYDEAAERVNAWLDDVARHGRPSDPEPLVSEETIREMRDLEPLDDWMDRMRRQRGDTR